MEIEITGGFVAHHDPEDAPLINGLTWYPLINRRAMKVYAMSKLGSMHRLVIKAADGEVVKHLDGNGLNNKKENLVKRCVQYLI